MSDSESSRNILRRSDLWFRERALTVAIIGSRSVNVPLNLIVRLNEELVWVDKEIQLILVQSVKEMERLSFVDSIEITDG